MPTSLVTGGAGFIGSHVVDHLLKMGHNVIVMDDLSGGSRENLPDAPPTIFSFLEWSILDREAIDYAFWHFRPDYVFHLAAYAAEGLSHHIRRYNYETNVIGSVNLINAAINYGVKRFVFASSAAVYGMNANIANEEQPPTPIDPYGIAKWTVEQDLMAAEKSFGLPYTIFRPHNVYGERQNLSDGYRNVVGIFMRQCLLKEPLPIYGDGTQKREFTYIKDVAPYIAAAIDNPRTENQTYNIGSDEEISVNLLAAWVGNAVGYYSPVIYLPERIEARHVRLDHSKFKDDFDTNKISLMAWGPLDNMARWAKTQSLGEPKPFTAIEIEKNLPEHWRKLSANHR